MASQGKKVKRRRPRAKAVSVVPNPTVDIDVSDIDRLVENIISHAEDTTGEAKLVQLNQLLAKSTDVQAKLLRIAIVRIERRRLAAKRDAEDKQFREEYEERFGVASKRCG